jgi:hypothetical protein
MTDNGTNRATAIVNAMGEMELWQLWDLMENILVSGPVDYSDPLAALIRDSFHGDDDYDDLRHEIEHELGDCSDDDDNCPWNDDEDM